MENYKREIGTNNCQNDIKSLKSNNNNNVMNNPQEIVNTFNDHFLTVAANVFCNIKKITIILQMTLILPNTWTANLIPHF